MGDVVERASHPPRRTARSSAAQDPVPYSGGQLAHTRNTGVSFGQVCDDLADGRAVADLGWSLLVRGQQRAGGLLGFAPLPPRAGHVSVQPSAPLGCGELAGMQHSPGIQGRTSVAEGPVDADAIEGDLGWGDSERLPSNGMVWQPGGGLFGFGDQFQGAVPVAPVGSTALAAREVRV
ncbi:MAG: hypothetical protein ACRDTA_26920 [Pseudonocardiaceae bacterium]